MSVFTSIRCSRMALSIDSLQRIYQTDGFAKHESF